MKTLNTLISGLCLIISAYGLSAQAPTLSCSLQPSSSAPYLQATPHKIELGGVPMLHALQWMERPIEPCPYTPIALAEVQPGDAYLLSYPENLEPLLSQTVDFVLSCEDCSLSELQAFGYDFLRGWLLLQQQLQRAPHPIVGVWPAMAWAFR